MNDAEAWGKTELAQLAGALAAERARGAGLAEAAQALLARFDLSQTRVLPVEPTVVGLRVALDAYEAGTNPGVAIRAVRGIPPPEPGAPSAVEAIRKGRDAE